MSINRQILILCISLVLCIFFPLEAGSEQCVPNSNQNQDLNLRILSPVILVPGCGGNKLRARLFKENVPHFFCSKHSDWYDIWLNPGQLLPFFIDCWVENIKLYYNYVSLTTFNVPGVDLEAPDFGRTDAVEDIDTTVIFHVHSFGAYYRPIVDALVKRGYVRHRSIFGAPYDFRKGPNETNDWLMKLKNLAECAYRTNSNAGVTFIVHSMGAKMTLYFLQTMTQEWKDQYVKQVISLSAPWGGSMKAIQAVSVGYDFGVNILQSSKLKMALQTFPSIAWMMPSSDFWPWYEVLVTMGKKKYTIQNIDQFLYDIGVPNSVEMRKDLIPYNNFTAPGVEIHCLYGNIADSIAEGLNFGADYNPKPTILNGYGDGTVNIRSLRGCGRWKTLNHMQSIKKNCGTLNISIFLVITKQLITS